MQPAELTELMRRIEHAFLYDMPGVTEVWLVRHGDCYEGLTELEDPPLSPLGHRQAQRLAARIQAAGITSVYSSPSQRARQTAEVLTSNVNVDDRLREMENNPGEAAKFVLNPQQSFSEPPEQVVARMAAAIDEAIAAHLGERIALVTHGVALLTYVGSLLRIEFGNLRLFPYYTSVTVVRALGERRMVGSLVDAAHLEGGT